MEERRERVRGEKSEERDGGSGKKRGREREVCGRVGLSRAKATSRNAVWVCCVSGGVHLLESTTAAPPGAQSPEG